MSVLGCPQNNKRTGFVCRVHVPNTTRKRSCGLVPALLLCACVCVCVHDCLDFSLRLGKENIIDSLSIVPFHLMILDLWADYHPSNFLSSLIFLRAFYPATLFALLGLLLILSPERTLQSDTAQHAVHRSFSQQKHVLLPDVSTHFISHFLSASQLTKLALTKKTDRADDNQKAQGLCCHVFPKKVDELAVLSHEVVDNRMIH